MGQRINMRKIASSAGEKATDALLCILFLSLVYIAWPSQVGCLMSIMAQVLGLTWAVVCLLAEMARIVFAWSLYCEYPESPAFSAWRSVKGFLADGTLF